MADTNATRRCPVCKSSKIELYATVSRYVNDDEQRAGRSAGATLGYKCECGAAFTDEVKYAPAQLPDILPSNPSENGGC